MSVVIKEGTPDARTISLRDPRSLGVATRICMWLANIDAGKEVKKSDLTWLVGKKRSQEYGDAIKADSKEAAAKKKMRATDDVNDGEVTGYISAFNNAVVLTRHAMPVFESKQAPGSKGRAKAYDKWVVRREKAVKAMEAMEEAWERVDPKHHGRFHHPRPMSDPEGPGWGSEVSKVIASMEWPPYIPKSQLEYLPEPNLVDIPRHQQRELLLDELNKLLVEVPATAPTAALKARMASLTKRGQS